MILKFLVTGYCILFTAILANIIADFLHILTWYHFLEKIINIGFKKTINSINIINAIWLFIIYPIVLSLGYLIGKTLYIIMMQ